MLYTVVKGKGSKKEAILLSLFGILSVSTSSSSGYSESTQALTSSNSLQGLHHGLRYPDRTRLEGPEEAGWSCIQFSCDLEPNTT